MATRTEPLSPEEQRYLLAAFAESRHDWFAPHLLDPKAFTEIECDRIIETLVQRGMIDAQPQLHARLTDVGRKEATKLIRFPWGERPRGGFQKRKAGILEIATTIVVVALLVVVLKWGGLF